MRAGKQTKTVRRRHKTQEDSKRQVKPIRNEGEGLPAAVENVTPEMIALKFSNRGI